MSQFPCRCGRTFDGPARQAWAAYRAHGCEHHPSELADQPDERPDWRDRLVVALILLTTALLVWAACAGGFTEVRP